MRMLFQMQFSWGPSQRVRVPQRGLWAAVAIVGLSLVATKPASAGYWTLDHYKYDFDRSGTEFSKDNQGHSASTPLYDANYGYSGAPHYGGLSSDYKMEFWGDFLDYLGPDVQHPAGTGSMKLSATAYYKWNGDDEPAEFIYTKERLQLYIGREHFLNGDYTFNSHPQEAPYTGDGFHIDFARDGFNTPLDDAGHVNPFNGGYGSGTDLQATGFWFHPLHFGVIPSKGQHMVPGVTRTIQVQVSSPNGWNLVGAQQSRAWYNVQYQAEIANLGIAVRRKSSGNDFSSGATIAAGHKSTDEHAAEVALYVNGLPGVPLSELPPIRFRQNTEQGKEIPATFEPTDDPNSVTDGNGRVIAKIVRSRDKTSTSGPDIPAEDGPTVVEWNIGAGYVLPSASLDQVWDGQDDWEYDEFFDIDEPSPIVFRPKIADAGASVNIQNHQLRFYAKQIHVIGADGDETLSVDNPEDAAIMDALVTFSPALSSDSGDGTYESTMTVQDSPDYTVDSVEFYAEDQGVYER